MNKTNNTASKQSPNRPLRSDFTAYTLHHARTAQRRARCWHGLRTWFKAPQKQENSTMKLLHKPLFAALGVLVIIGLGGTTYAAVNGGLSSITALFGSETKLQGSRIVKVELQNCHDVNPFNVVSGTGKGDTPRYYRVKDDAKLTNAQLVSLAQSVCRSSYSSPAEQALYTSVGNRPENKDTLIGNGEGTIVALTTTSVDIEVGANVTSNHEPYVEHFTSLDPALTVLDGSGEAKDISALKVGDTVYSNYRSMSGASYPTETTALNDVDWSKQVLVMVTKQSPDLKAYDEFNTLSQGKLIEQVVPCHNTSNGYCTFEQLNK